jgi:prepilin-type N-terminal cleavage/methylation domain-containing protein
MNKKTTYRDGFTLVEVMVSVVIISTVIMALFQMFANNTHIFSTLKQQAKISGYTSFFISNEDYGFEKDDITLYELIDGFKVEDELRKELKSIKAKIIYQELESIDMSEFDEDDSDLNLEKKEVDSEMVFEVGKTILKVNDTSSALLRIGFGK